MSHAKYTCLVFIHFPLSDVPELPEEVEAIVCDAGDLAEG